MAPELLLDEVSSFEMRADTYSMALVLWQMVRHILASIFFSGNPRNFFSFRSFFAIQLLIFARWRTRCHMPISNTIYSSGFLHQKIIARLFSRHTYIQILKSSLVQIPSPSFALLRPPSPFFTSPLLHHLLLVSFASSSVSFSLPDTLFSFHVVSRPSRPTFIPRSAWPIVRYERQRWKPLLTVRVCWCWCWC